MRQAISVVLAAVLLAAFVACGGRPAPESNPQAISQTESAVLPEAPDYNPNLPIQEHPDYDPDRPIEEPEDVAPVEPPPFPGLPVYVTIDYSPPVQSVTPGEPQVEVETSKEVFDHFDDPPPESAVRLVYVYGYSAETEAVLLEDEAEVSRIVSIIDRLIPLDEDIGPQAGGYMVEIQAVINGVHQSYQAGSARYNGSQVIHNNRNDKWYETTDEDFELLMSYFGGMPG